MEKKGLSGVVSVMLIILITLAAIGIFWVVAKGVVGGSGDEIGLGQKCLETDIKITGFQYNNPNWTIRVERKSGTEEFAGIKFILYDSSLEQQTSSAVEDPSIGNINLLESDTAIIDATGSGITNPKNIDKVDVVVYFDAEKGEHLCPPRSFDVSDLR